MRASRRPPCVVWALTQRSEHPGSASRSGDSVERSIASRRHVHDHHDTSTVRPGGTVVGRCPRGGRLTRRGGRSGGPVDRLAGLRQRSPDGGVRDRRGAARLRRPSRATTSLALARVPATDAEHRIGTVFVNPGGPGGSGVGFVLNGFGEYLRDNLGGRFDVVGFDPAGSAPPILCTASTARMTRLRSSRRCRCSRTSGRSTGRSTTSSPRSPAGA